MVRIKKTKKDAKPATKPRPPVATGYLMNGDKMEFFKPRVRLSEIRVAAANKLDPKRFAPEIIVIRDAKKIDDEYSKGVLQCVAVEVRKDIDFWLEALEVHFKAKDYDGVKRALVEMSQDARNGLLLKTVRHINAVRNTGHMADYIVCPLGTGPQIIANFGSDMNAAALQDVEREVGACRVFEQDGRPGPFLPHPLWPECFADLLLRYGADPLAENVEGRNLLHQASIMGLPRIVELLLQRGVNVNAKGRDGLTSILWACSPGSLSVARLLLKYGANPNDVDSRGWSCLTYAARAGRRDIAQILLDNKADVNLLLPETGSCLHEACYRGDADIVELLIKNKADVKVIDSHGMTSLLWACQQGHVKVVRFLLMHGASANEVNSKTGGSCLNFAACWVEPGSFETAQLLVKNKADVNQLDNEGSSCLMTACVKGYICMARLLLEQGANVNLENEDKRSSLSLASQNGAVDIVKMLLQNGASPLAVDGQGRRADWWAKENGHADVEALLITAISTRSGNSNAQTSKSGSKKVLKQKALKNTCSRIK